MFVLAKWDKIDDPRAHFEELKLVAQRKPAASARRAAGDRGRALRRRARPADEGGARKRTTDWTARVKTKDLNDWLHATVERHPPPAVRGKRIKPRYITQIKARPPTFVLICSRAEDMPESYKRYLVNGIRDAFDLHAAPVRLIVKAGKNPFVEERVARSRRAGRSVTGGQGERP